MPSHCDSSCLKNTWLAKDVTPNQQKRSVSHADAPLLPFRASSSINTQARTNATVLLFQSTTTQHTCHSHIYQQTDVCTHTIECNKMRPTWAKHPKCTLHGPVGNHILVCSSIYVHLPRYCAAIKRDKHFLSSSCHQYLAGPPAVETHLIWAEVVPDTNMVTQVSN